MNKLKDALLSGLGWVGMVIYWAIGSVIAFAPLFFLDFPFLADIVIIGVVMFMPILQNIVRPVIWISALIAAIQGPIDVFAIIYFIFFAFYAFAGLVQDVLTVCMSIPTFIMGIFANKDK